MSWAVCAKVALPNGLVGANVLAVDLMCPRWSLIVDTATMVAWAGVPHRKLIQTLMAFVRTVTKDGHARYAS